MTREKAIAFVRQTVENYRRAYSLQQSALHPLIKAQQDENLKLWEELLVMIDFPQGSSEK